MASFSIKKKMKTFFIETIILVIDYQLQIDKVNCLYIPFIQQYFSSNVDTQSQPIKGIGAQKGSS